MKVNTHKIKCYIKLMFRTILDIFLFLKVVWRILIEITLNLCIAFSIIVIFTVLALPINEHGESSHFYQFPQVIPQRFKIFTIEIFYLLRIILKYFTFRRIRILDVKIILKSSSNKNSLMVAQN